jgi:hypothetical protein
MSKVKSLVPMYEGLAMKEFEPGHLLKSKKVYKFGDTNLDTYESPNRKRRLCPAAQAGSSSSPVHRGGRRWWGGGHPLLHSQGLPL